MATEGDSVGDLGDLADNLADTLDNLPAFSQRFFRARPSYHYRELVRAAARNRSFEQEARGFYYGSIQIPYDAPALQNPEHWWEPILAPLEMFNQYNDSYWHGSADADPLPLIEFSCKAKPFVPQAPALPPPVRPRWEEVDPGRPIDHAALHPPGLMESLAQDLDRRLEETRRELDEKRRTARDPYAASRLVAFPPDFLLEERRLAEERPAGPPQPYVAQRLARLDAKGAEAGAAAVALRGAPTDAGPEARRAAVRRAFPGPRAVSAPRALDLPGGMIWCLDRQFCDVRWP